jgi:AcrR family transcriptional regulator
MGETYTNTARLAPAPKPPLDDAITHPQRGYAMPALLTDEQLTQAREKIVQEAERQAVALGLERVSTHSIAKALGWSATALYRYFENKDAILAAARATALNRLSAHLEGALAGAGDIWALSREIGNAYTAFAFNNPDAYRLIFALAQPDVSLYPALASALARARRNMTHYVERMVAEGGLAAEPVILGHLFWAGLHGLITLQMAGQLGPDAPSFETLRHEMVRALVRGAARG